MRVFFLQIRLIYLAYISVELIESIIMLVWMWVPLMSSVTAGILNLNQFMKLQEVIGGSQVVASEI